MLFSKINIIYCLINISEILAELLCKNMISSHMKIRLLFSHVKRSPLTWLHHNSSRPFCNQKLFSWNILVLHWCLLDIRTLCLWLLGNNKFLFSCWTTLEDVRVQDALIIGKPKHTKEHIKKDSCRYFVRKFSKFST